VSGRSRRRYVRRAKRKGAPHDWHHSREASGVTKMPEASPEKTESMKMTLVRVAWRTVSRLWKWVKEKALADEQRRIRVTHTTTHTVEIELPRDVPVGHVLAEAMAYIRQQDQVKSLRLAE
jgi:hypothetical protein